MLAAAGAAANASSFGSAGAAPAAVQQVSSFASDIESVLAQLGMKSTQQQQQQQQQQKQPGQGQGQVLQAGAARASTGLSPEKPPPATSFAGLPDATSRQIGGFADEIKGLMGSLGMSSHKHVT